MIDAADNQRPAACSSQIRFEKVPRRIRELRGEMGGSVPGKSAEARDRRRHSGRQAGPTGETVAGPFRQTQPSRWAPQPAAPLVPPRCAPPALAALPAAPSQPEPAPPSRRGTAPPSPWAPPSLPPSPPPLAPAAGRALPQAPDRAAQPAPPSSHLCYLLQSS